MRRIEKYGVNLKRERGITLVSLVVTIIVMIILAAIVIRAMDGLDVATETVNIVDQAYSQNKTEMEEELNNTKDKWGNIIDKTGVDNEIEYTAPDGTKPTDDAPTVTPGITKLTVKCNQEDTGSGIVEIEYAIRKKGEREWSEWQTSNIFRDLESKTEYEVKTKAKDGMGNESQSAVKEASTLELLVGSLTLKLDNSAGAIYRAGTPTNHNVYVMINAGNGERTTVRSIGNSAQTVNETEENVTVTTEGTTRVEVKTIEGSEEVIGDTYEIYIDKTPPTDTAPDGISTVDTIRAEFKQEDTGSGIKTMKYRLTNAAGTTGNWVEDTNGTHTFTGLTQNTEYYIQTQATDEAGNVRDSKVTVVRTKERSVYAKLYDNDNDGEGDTLVFSSTEEITYTKGTLKKDYGEVPEFGSAESQSWASDVGKIKKAEIFDNIKPTSTAYWFMNCNEMTEIENIGYIDTSEVGSMRSMFENCGNITTLNVSTFDTRNVTNMESMFNGCKKITQINVSNFNTSKVKNMSYMFACCLKVQSLDVTNFNTANVETMARMFAGDTTSLSQGSDNRMALTEIRGLENFNTAKVTNMSMMFYMCINLTSLNLSSFDTSNVTDISGIFAGNWSDTRYDMQLTEIRGIENLNVSKVQNFSRAFSICRYLTNLDLGSWNTSSATNMENMFFACSNLEDIDISSFNTSNVTNMAGMFAYDYELEELDLSNFDTSKVTNMWRMFNLCSNLTYLNVSSFDTSNVTTMTDMFAQCKKLTEIDVSSFNTNKVKSMDKMFYSTSPTQTELTTIYASDQFVTDQVTNSTNMFLNSTKLVGGLGTTYDANHIDKEYALIDGGEDNPGYFTSGRNYKIVETVGENETIKYYKKLQEAVEDATTGQTITMLTDYIDPSDATVSGKSIVFDNNGKDLRISNTIKILNGATLEITGEGSIRTDAEIDLIDNKGTLNITHTGIIQNEYESSEAKAIKNTGTMNKTGNGTITAYNTTIESESGIVNISDGIMNVSGTEETYGATIIGSGTTVMNITGGTIQNNGNYSSSGIYWTSSNNLELDGNVSIDKKCVEGDTSGYGINNSSSTGGIVIIKDGYYYSEGEAVAYIKSTGEISIAGGNLEGKYIGIQLMDNSSISISGEASVSGKSFGIALFGEKETANNVVNISGGAIISSEDMAICNNINNGIVNIDGGTVVGDRPIRISYEGIVNISGDSIIKGNKDVVSATTNGTITITGGTIIADDPNVASVSAGAGSTVNIGSIEEELSTESPLLIGRVWFNANASWNFYNGIIKVPTDIEEDIRYKNVSNREETAVRPNHEVVTGTEEIEGKEYYTAYLKDVRNYSIVGKTGYYKTLEEAHAAATAGDTIQVLKDVVDDSNPVISKNVKLDTNGHILEKTTNQITVNSGVTFEVTGAGTLTTSDKIVLISVFGTLNITHTGKISNTYTGEENTRCIANSGTLNKTGSGIITAGTKYTTIGNNSSNSICTISAGTVESTGPTAAIHTYGDSTLNIEGTARIISTKSNAISLGNDSSDGNANIKGGEVIGNQNGIYHSRGTLNIGEADKTLSTTTPLVRGGNNVNTFGINKNGGTFNFYNGILKGIDGGVNEKPDKVRTGYGVATGTENIEGVTFNTQFLKELVNITYDYNSTTTFESGEASDSGMKLDWNKDFSITEVVNIPAIGKRYLILGNYKNSTTNNEMNLEINASNKLRVWINNAQRSVSTGTVAANTDITVTFNWNASTKTYTMTSTGTNSNASTTGTVDVSGTSEQPLMYGTQDNRGSTVFNPITVKSLRITLPEVKENNFESMPEPGVRKSYMFTGWYTTTTSGNVVTENSTVPSSNTTYYAHWKEGFIASKSNVTVVYTETENVTLSGPEIGAISIKTQPDTSIATATLSGTTLKITGKSVGTTKVVLEEANNHQTVTVNITVVAKSIKGCTVDDIAAVTYNGSAKTPAPVVKDGTTTLTKNTHYTLAYSNNTNAGTATITITGKGNYKDSITKTFKINKAAPTLTLSATSGTIIAGNSTTFTITYDGDGALSVSSNATAKATASLSSKTVTVKGVAVGSATITVTAAAGTNYSGKTATYAATVQAAIYEVSSVASGKQKYHTTLVSAVAASNAGATVKALANASETGNVTITKNLTINTNGKNISRENGSIRVEGGTVTLSGTGSVVNTSDKYAIIVTDSAVFKTSGTPLIQSAGNGIHGADKASISILGGYVYAIGRGPIIMSDQSNLTLTDAYVYTPKKDKNAIYYSAGSTGTLTINGDSSVGNGYQNASGLDGSGNYSGTINTNSTGKVTLAGTCGVYAGPYGGNAIYCSSKCTVECKEHSKIYALNENDKDGILMNATGGSIIFNSDKWFYCTGSHVASTGSYNSAITVTKGQFVSRNSKYMFFKNGANDTTNVSTGTAGDRVFNYMNSYKTRTTKTISGCYYYKKGV